MTELFRFVGELPALSQDHPFFGTTFDGSPIASWAVDDDIVAARTWSAGHPADLELPNRGSDRPLVQPLPDDGWLVVDYTTDDEVAETAWMVSRDGSIARTFDVGMGVTDVQVTPAGHVWLARADEGIFSDREPADGLMCVSLEGSLLWGARQVRVWMADCYAMNATASQAWGYYYEGFKLLQVAGFRVNYHAPAPVSYAGAVALNADGCVFGGGRDRRWPPSRDISEMWQYVFWWPWGASSPQAIELTFPTASRPRFTARSDRLFVRAGREVWATDVQTVASHVALAPRS